MIVNAQAGRLPLADASVDAALCSPPYWGAQRVYTGAQARDWPAIAYPPMSGLPPVEIPAQHVALGHEEDPFAFVAHLLQVFREVRRVLRPHAVLAVNLGDSYANDAKWGGYTGGKHVAALHGNGAGGRQKRTTGIPAKNLVLMPWRFALAMQADGWVLRSRMPGGVEAADGDLGIEPDILWKKKCLSGGVKVYARTQKGEMPTTIKDLVRLDASTVKLWGGDKWNQVVSFTGKERPERVLELRLRSGEAIGCTPEHRFPTSRGLLPADEIRPGDTLASARLPPPGRPRTPRLIPDDFGWLVGFFLAEGTEIPGGVALATHVDRLAELGPLVKRWADDMGSKYWERTTEPGGKGGTMFVVGGTVLAALRLYVHGKRAKTKGVKVACWQRSNDFLRHLWRGYLDGDGHRDKRNQRWRLGFTRNDRLAADFRTLTARLGGRLVLNKAWSKCEGKMFPSYRGEYRESPGEHPNSKSPLEVLSIGANKSRKVWDIELAEAPHVFALASGVLSHNSCMPESVRDRPTVDFEDVLVFSQGPRYFWDQEAGREPALQPSGSPELTGQHKASVLQSLAASHLGTNQGAAGRNMRACWVINPEPTDEEHFAAWPVALAARLIRVMTSEKGVCPDCGAPWVREVERTTGRDSGIADGRPSNQQSGGRGSSGLGTCSGADGWAMDGPRTTTIGWSSSCAHNTAPVPATVLDPFAGLGRTWEAARETGRRFVGTDLGFDYCRMALSRNDLTAMARRRNARKPVEDFGPLFALDVVG